MKKYIINVGTFAMLMTVVVLPSFAQLNVPSDGSDGLLNITTNTVIDLSQALTGNWTNISSGKGVYDPAQWAVVFKYSSVNISSNATVTFVNHYANPPVVWLVQSNVIINGTLSLNGHNGTNEIPAIYLNPEAGPGGYRGGAGGQLGFGSGFGLGGGKGPFGDSGSYAGMYGNAQILPLIGGSGSSADANGYNGGGGGGAILIAASGNITLDGQITANGGTVVNRSNSGSGGGIRLVANQIHGSGQVYALGGGAGIIRIEANDLDSALIFEPSTVLASPGTMPVIWQINTAPTAKILSVDTQNVPVDPHDDLSTSADVGIQNINPVNITVQTQNFPIQGIVSVRVTPKNGAATVLNAAYSSGDVNQALWIASTALPLGFATVQAQATKP